MPPAFDCGLIDGARAWQVGCYCIALFESLNIEFHHYAAGHMVYVSPPELKALHDNVADFIRRTDNVN